VATTTTKLGLRKPAGTDLINVTTDLSNNYDIIDAYETAASAVTIPQPVGAANTAGVAVAFARADHVHDATALANSLTAALTIPPGMMMQYAGAAAPTGWVLCNGAAISRATFAALFAIIGTTYGVGDGSTTFNLPDLRSRVPMGAGTGTGLSARALAAVGGAETHLLTVGELVGHNHLTTEANHNHGITDPQHHHDGSGDGGVGSAAVRYGPSVEGLVLSPTATRVTFAQSANSPTGVSTNGASTGLTTQNQGGGAAFSIMEPFIVLNYVIKT
jgi:microcystin-dependent protein